MEAVNQHYIPKFYLEYFKNENGLVETFCKKYKTNKKPYSTKSLCSEDYFYWLKTWERDEVYKAIEYLYKEYEDKHSMFLKDFISKVINNEKIEETDIFTLCEFIVTTWFRGKSFRDYLKEWQIQLTKSYIRQMSFRDPKIAEGYKLIEKWEISIEMNNNNHLDWILDEEIKNQFINLLAHKQIKIYIATWKHSFITSDNFLLDLSYAKDRKTIYWVDFMSKLHYVTLTPKILIEFTRPMDKKIKVKKAKRKRIDDDKVLYFNQLRSYDCEYLYSNDKADIDEWLLIETELNNIENLSRLFWDKFNEYKKNVDWIEWYWWKINNKKLIEKQLWITAEFIASIEAKKLR